MGLQRTGHNWAHTHTHTHTHARVGTWLENLCKAMPEGQLGSCLGSKGCFCYHQDLWLRHSPAISYNFPSPAGYSMRAANAWPHLSQPKHHRYTSAPMLSFWKIRAGVPDQGKHRAGTSNPVQELGMLSLESECKWSRQEGQGAGEETIPTRVLRTGSKLICAGPDVPSLELCEWQGDKSWDQRRKQSSLLSIRDDCGVSTLKPKGWLTRSVRINP